MQAYARATPNREAACARPQMSKLGDRRRRRLLVIGTWSAQAQNPACPALYEYLRGRGQAGKQALCVVAVRLLRQAWTLWPMHAILTLETIFRLFLNTVHTGIIEAALLLR